MTLVCDCRIRLRRADGKEVTVKGRKWDCPSCGTDKARTIRDMVVAEGVDRLTVLTFPQPEDTGVPPAGFDGCDPESHIYTHADGRRLWRRLETCAGCCQATSRMVVLLRKRMRRRWGNGVQVLWVREVKPRSGAFDYNVVLSNVPVLTRRGREGRWLKAAWADISGGFLDLGDGHKANHSPGAMGRYVGKYLTKLAHRRMAKGYRRWGRTGDFAPDVRMRVPIYGCRERPMTWTMLGWLDPLTDALIPDFMRPLPPPGFRLPL